MVYQRGSSNLRIESSLFAENRTRLCAELRAREAPAGSWVVLQGNSEVPIRPGSDCNDFRQDGYFIWAFGVEEPDFFGAIDVQGGRSILFAPRLDAEYGTWMGKLRSPQEFGQKYGIDGVYYTDEMADILQGLNPSALLLLNGVSSDSGLNYLTAKFDGMDRFKTDSSDLLFWAMNECRVIKTAKEIEVMRYVCAVSSDAHMKLMKNAKPGVWEYQLESMFHDHCYREGGCRFTGYTCIGASGPNCAILHYGHAGEPNSRQLKDGDMCLFDMGAEYCGYTADITCSYPVSGRFSPDQKIIYNAVKAAVDAVMAAAKPEVAWPDMHRLANRALLEKLKEGGLVTGDVDAMLKEHVAAVFQPHGLGHLIGIDVHDVGGYPPGMERIQEPGIKSLRTCRTLKAGMCLTVEPGCYFNPYLLEKAFANPAQKPFLVEEVIRRFWDFGGVRIEDDVLITETGCENLNKQIPRSIEGIEKLING